MITPKQEAMKVSLISYVQGRFDEDKKGDVPDPGATSLVMGFGAKPILETEHLYAQLRTRFPAADIVLCSTSGEIYNASVLDNTVSIVAIQLEKSKVETASVTMEDFDGNSFEAGKALAGKIKTGKDLTYIMILSDGGKVNGSQLITGFNKHLRKNVPVTGGLAGDAADFNYTVVGLNEEPVPGRVVAVAFYGKDLRMSHGSMGGWETFGVERVVTKSHANRLFEIDGKNALELYKKYLGSYADELPGSALLFPLSVRLPGGSDDVVRTILSIDETSRSMVFAGDVPEGAKVRFMKANFDKLIDAASDAARQTFRDGLDRNPRLAILISCVGRKVILGNRIEEEVEAVQRVFGSKTLLAGFYSYGEISPFAPDTKCELHNQTMTITTLDEQ